MEGTEALVTHRTLTAQLVYEEVHDVLGMTVQLLAQLSEVYDCSLFRAHTR